MSLRARALLGRDVRFGDIRVGLVIDVVFDLDARCVLGLDVRCGDEAHRFLPMRACEVSADDVVVASPFVLMEGALHGERACRLSSLRDAGIVRDGAKVGRLVDVAIDGEGIVTNLVVSTAGRTREIPLAPDLALERRPLRPAV